jgi:hypothetical protein
LRKPLELRHTTEEIRRILEQNCLHAGLNGKECRPTR